MSILDRIVEDTHERVRQAKERISPREMAKSARETEQARDFFAAIRTAVISREQAVIAEIKRRSPSAGLIRDDFDPVDIAKRYHKNGAAALSCLTEPNFFGGDLGFIQSIRKAVPLPVLRKDFLIDPYQVYEARAAGADAILLIAECLSEELLAEMLEIAESLSMTTLLEIHDEKNLDIALDIFVEHRPLRALLGINNRDLSTMTTDIRHTLDLLSRVADRSIVVSESGIRSHDDLLMLREHDVRIVLVGESLMKQPDPGAALAELLTGR